MFYSLEDARSYLRDSVIIHKPSQTPVYVLDINLAYDTTTYTVLYISLLDVPAYYVSDRPKQYLKSDPIDCFSWKGMFLGYIQIKDRAYYASRIPSRQWKKGLTKNNIFFYTNGEGVGTPWTTWMGAPLHNTLTNSYISLKTAFDMVEAKRKPVEFGGPRVSAAFTRQLAVSLDSLGIYKLHFRGEEVAFSTDKKVFKLGDNHLYLKEVLSHNGVALI